MVFEAAAFLTRPCALGSHHATSIRGLDVAAPARAEPLHAQCLSSAALLASDRLACQGALPLLAHALSYGSRCRGAELEAQAASLSLLLRLTEAHGPLVLEPLQSRLAALRKLTSSPVLGVGRF